MVTIPTVFNHQATHFGVGKFQDPWSSGTYSTPVILYLQDDVELFMILLKGWNLPKLANKE